MALFTNGGHAHDLCQDLFREIFPGFTGVRMPPPPAPPTLPVQADITPYLGRYERAGLRAEVLAGTGKTKGPVLRSTVTGPLAEMLPGRVSEYPMTPAGPDQWLTREPGTRTWSTVTFYTLPTGERYLHHGSRATPRV